MTAPSWWPWKRAEKKPEPKSRIAEARFLLQGDSLTLRKRFPCVNYDRDCQAVARWRSELERALATAKTIRHNDALVICRAVQGVIFRDYVM